MFPKRGQSIFYVADLHLRVPFLTNGAAKPTVATIIGSGEDGLLLSRKSLAAWLLKQLKVDWQGSGLVIWRKLALIQLLAVLAAFRARIAAYHHKYII